MNRKQRHAVSAAPPVTPARQENFLALYNAAVSSYHQGRVAEAERLFAAAAKLLPGMAQAQLAHAKVLVELGRIEAALDCYDQVLRREPRHADALNDRAWTLLGAGRLAAALATLDRLLAIDPSHGLALFNRASALRGLGRLEEALATIEAVIATRPDLAEAQLLRAAILADLGRRDDALTAYAAVLHTAPDRIDVLNDQGKLLIQMGRLEEALANYDRALELAPEFFEALVNRGLVLQKLGRIEAELASYDRALALRPESGIALVARGMALHALRRHGEALESLARASALNPADATAMGERALVLFSRGQQEEAVACMRAAVAMAPEDPQKLNNLALMLRMMGHLAEAAEAFAGVVRLRPDYPYALGELVTSRLSCCDWAGLEESVAALDSGVAAGRPVCIPFQLLQLSDSPQALLACARQFAADRLAPPRDSWVAPAPRPGERIRVAYLSADLQNHATAFLMAGVFEAHDRARFETFAVSFAADDGSAMRQRLVPAFDHFIDASGLGDPALIARLRELRIDIAVDLKGFTNGARAALFRQRVAPVQVNFLGYPCTWGDDCMDYLIADPWLVPPGEEAFYTERIVRLPESYQPTDRTRVIAEPTPTRAELGLPERGFVFCCFNASFKIMPPVFARWLRLLRQVEGSVLWLLETNGVASANLRRAAAAGGVAPERLVFGPGLPPEHHLARLRRADLVLDTLPYNAHTTASDALWAGVPVLTCVGSTFPGRVAASLLHAAGLSRLITRSPAEYEALALHLAAAPDELAELRAGMAETRLSCKLFDTRRFCRHLEAAFAGMHARRARGEAPAGFDVPALADAVP